MFLKSIARKMVPLKTRALIHDLMTGRQTKKALMQISNELLYYKVLYHYQCNPSSDLAQELEFLKATGTITPFTYRQLKETPLIQGGYDKKKQMPYVIHKEKRLYFPASWKITDAKAAYLNYIVTEDILGKGYMEKAPHCYLSENCMVKEGDTVFDVGAAEGLFLLHVIDEVQKGYVFEPNVIWQAPLRATFEPFKEKVVVVNKYAAHVNSGNKTRLDSYHDTSCGSIFMKLDVEGFEQLALNGASQLLATKADVRIACCTYHKQDDAEMLKAFFEERNYETEYSDGYILFPYFDNLKPPYFRKGIIRAWKSSL